MRDLMEERAWQRWRDEVKKAYYIDELDVEVCLEKAYKYIDSLNEMKIKLSDVHSFSLFVEMAEMLIENNNLLDAKMNLIEAEEYIQTEYNRIFLCWKKADLYYICGNLEESENLYLETMAYFDELEDFENVNVYKNLIEVKHQYAKKFNEYKYVKDIIDLSIDLHIEGNKSLSDLRDTYSTFQKLALKNGDVQELIKITNKLTELNITL